MLPPRVSVGHAEPGIVYGDTVVVVPFAHNVVASCVLPDGRLLFATKPMRRLDGFAHRSAGRGADRVSRWTWRVDRNDPHSEVPQPVPHTLDVSDVRGLTALPGGTDVLLIAPGQTLSAPHRLLKLSLVTGRMWLLLEWPMPLNPHEVAVDAIRIRPVVLPDGHVLFPTGELYHPIVDPDAGVPFDARRDTRPGPFPQPLRPALVAMVRVGWLTGLVVLPGGTVYCFFPPHQSASVVFMPTPSVAAATVLADPPTEDDGNPLPDIPPHIKWWTLPLRGTNADHQPA